ncbi:MAG: nucleoside triphosphate pyrophosphohydrolase [Firmicutes bacterium HGW-Firmicutes-7]|nr:MAG: nucleoside triphosphate pyrophosphohydrolase [Firmicutes bacterium HGW-Firmicutes-7]
MQIEKWQSKKEKYGFEDLRRIIDILRGEGGCPWDMEQTHESLKSGTLEEVYEVLEAIENKDVENLKEELGDLLLHVMFHSKIAENLENFNLDEVIHDISEKLIRRHPHVFQDEKAESSDEVKLQWEEIKKAEKQYSSFGHKLESVPRAMPALLRAYKVQQKASMIGFDFSEYKQAFSKVLEELREFEEALAKGEKSAIQDEYGDLLFSMVNISRFFELNPEISLTNATEKFINRFKGIEEMAQNKGFELDKLSIIEMDQLWDEFKITQ